MREDFLKQHKKGGKGRKCQWQFINFGIIREANEIFRTLFAIEFDFHLDGLASEWMADDADDYRERPVGRLETD